MQDKQLLFGKKQLFTLIWPLLVEQLLTVFVGMVDVLMVASVGEAAVSGVSLVDSINLLIIQVLFAVTAGGTVVCAQYIGAGKKKEAGRTTAQLLLLTLTATALITLIFLIGRGHILGMIFGQVEAGVMRNASIYMLITTLSFPFLAFYNSGAAAFRAVGDTRTAMLISLFMNVLNIAGNALCIFLLHMGVEGVAIPTFIARITGAIAILFLLQKQNTAASVHHLRDFIPNAFILRRILSIGVPSGVESGIFQLGKLTLQSLVSTLGTASIAGYAVASNLVTYLYLPGNALGAATLTVVGQCYGAGEKKQAKYYTRIMLFLNYAILAAVCSAMLIGNAFWVGFYHLSPEADHLAQGLIRIHSIAMIIWPIGFLIPYYFRAIGKSAFTMVIAIFTMWVFRIGLAYVFIQILKMNVLGIWYAMFVDWIFRTIIYLFAFHASPDTSFFPHARIKATR